MKSRFDLQMFHNEGEGGGGSGAGTQAPPKPSELVERYNGDALRMAEKLADVLTDNHKLRGEKADLKKKQTPDGAVILTGDDAAKWNAFNELGTPEELKTIKATGEAAIAERDELRAQATIAKAAELTGYKTKVLSDLAKSKGFTIEVEGDGEAAKVTARYKDGDKDKAVPLNEYVETSLSDYLPSLQADTPPTANTASVIPFPRMAAVGGGRTLSRAEQIRAEEAAKKAPATEAAVKVPTLEERMNMTRSA
jgi:hypothetical protein